MSDIVGWLRAYANRTTIIDIKRLDEAADEIERLRAANAELVEALRFYASGEWSDGYPGGVKIDDNTLDFGDTARAALEGK